MFANGLLKHEAGNSAQPGTFRWDQIEEAYQSRVVKFDNGKYDGTLFRYRFIRQGGTELTIKGAFKDPRYHRTTITGGRCSEKMQLYADVGEHGCRQVAAAKLPGALSALSNGATLAFGKISISEAGVDTKNGLVPWVDLRELQIQNGVLVIMKEGKFLPLFSRPVANIPNYPLFYLLVKTKHQEASSA